MNIKGSTNIVGLIGHPVEHSFSPPMHNAAFKALNMDYAYVAFDVDHSDLKSAIEAYENGTNTSIGSTAYNLFKKELNQIMILQITLIKNII